MKYSDRLKTLIGKQGHLERSSEYQSHFAFYANTTTWKVSTDRVQEVGDDYIIVENDKGEKIMIPLGFFVVFD